MVVLLVQRRRNTLRFFSVANEFLKIHCFLILVYQSWRAVLQWVLLASDVWEDLWSLGGQSGEPKMKNGSVSFSVFDQNDDRFRSVFVDQNKKKTKPKPNTCRSVSRSVIRWTRWARKSTFQRTYSRGPLIRTSNLGPVLKPYRAFQFQYNFLQVSFLLVQVKKSQFPVSNFCLS